MGMLASWLGGAEAGDDMARARPLDAKKVTQLTNALRAAGDDAAVLKEAYRTICDDDSLSAAEVIEIAHQYLGGVKPKSRKAALSAIGQERLRLAHAQAKAASAAKVRVW